MHLKTLRCASCGFEMTSAVSVSDVELRSFLRTHSPHAFPAQLRVRAYDRAMSLTAIDDEESLESARARGAAPVSVDEQQAMPGAFSQQRTPEEGRVS